MNILIINIDASPQFVGGIKKVHSILANLWAEDGHNVFFIAWCPSEVKYTEINGVRQIFFPDETTIFSAENVSFLREFVETNAIDIILNPYL